VSENLLEIEGMVVSLRSRAGDQEIVHGIDLQVAPGETLGVVGESGSGKTLTMLSVMRLLSPPLEMTHGSVRLEGLDLTGVPEAEMRQIRGARVAMVYQDPMTSLNPLMRVGDQVVEAMTAHGIPKDEAWERALATLKRVEMPDPERIAKAYPHELSGGMRQRALIAIALTMDPTLLIADEPTTALDVTIQRQILALVKHLSAESRMTTIWVTHDLGVIARLVDRVVVMYGGHVVEDAPVDQIFHAPQHPYTKRLLESLPNPTDDSRPPLAQIPGRPPLPSEKIEGCPFRPRCDQARDVCVTRPELEPREAGHAACWVPVDEWH
jgi:oligopeptide/dipeptide ABC transporter ATP-binding protein